MAYRCEYVLALVVRHEEPYWEPSIWFAVVNAPFAEARRLARERIDNDGHIFIAFLWLGIRPYIEERFLAFLGTIENVGWPYQGRMHVILA